MENARLENEPDPRGFSPMPVVLPAMLFWSVRLFSGPYYAPDTNRRGH